MRMIGVPPVREVMEAIKFLVKLLVVPAPFWAYLTHEACSKAKPGKFGLMGLEAVEGTVEGTVTTTTLLSCLGTAAVSPNEARPSRQAAVSEQAGLSMSNLESTASCH